MFRSSRAFSRRLRAMCAIGGLALLLTACGGSDEDPTATTEPVAAEATPTEVVATPTPEPTDTPAATVTPSPEPEPTATPTRITPAPTVAAPLYIPPTAVPTTAPEPEPEPEVPVDNPDPEPDVAGDDLVIGDLLLSTDLSDWPAVDFDFGFGYVHEGAYYIYNTSTEGQAIFMRSLQMDFSDVMASVDVQLTTTAAMNAYGCLITRADWEGTTFNYSLCINGWGESYAAYEYVDQDGNYQFDMLVEVATYEALNPPTEVNNLSILSAGSEFGFFINDQLIGVATHAGPPNGSVGFYVSNFDIEHAEYRFTNLEVWAVTQ